MNLIFFKKKYSFKKRHKHKHKFKLKFFKKRIDIYLILFKKKTYFNFFRKRLYLFKYYHRLAKVFLKKFFKNFKKKKFFWNKIKFFNNKNLILKKSIHKYFYKKKIKKRNRKIRFLRRYRYYIIKNATYFFSINFSIKTYKLFFKKFENLNNHNFFHLFFFNIYNTMILSKLFFNKHFLFKFFDKQGVYINGILCKNIRYLLNFSNLNFIQIVWCNSFFHYFFFGINIFYLKKHFLKKFVDFFFLEELFKKKIIK